MLRTEPCIVVLVLCLLVPPTLLLPIMRMKLCVASSNTHKLQNQCVYCHNKPYLPANVSIEEGYCMVRQCRTQMPGIRPEPYFGGNGNSLDTIGINVGDEYDDGSGYVQSSPVQSYQNQQNQLNQQQQLNVLPKPIRRRPPAHVFVGQPMRPSRPSLFGKKRRSIRDDFPSILSRPRKVTDQIGSEDWDTLYGDLEKRSRGLVALAVYANSTSI